MPNDKRKFYRSGLEKKFAEGVPRGLFDYEPCRVAYEIPKMYTPDFVSKDKSVYVECKGFFREGDTQKYKAIRDQLENHLLDQPKLVFVLSDPNKKVRKGSKITMGEWCAKEGFEVYTIATLDKLVERLQE